MTSSVLRITGYAIFAANIFISGAWAGNKNIVLIGWDTLRADHIHALGYKKNTTPNLDKFAGESVLFTNTSAQASWTLPSFMSVFTGMYPYAHGVTNKFKLPAEGETELVPLKLSTGIITLAQVFKANGYKTAAFTGGAGVSGEFGFARGFDVFVDSPNFTGFAASFPQATGWLKNNSGSNFFLFIHGYDTHPFHDLTADGNYAFINSTDALKIPGLRARHEKMRLAQIDGKKPAFTTADKRLWTAAYDEKIVRADKLLGGFLHNLESTGVNSENTIIVLFSDHGEELFDHGGIDHGMTLYEEVIKVPLIIRVPGSGAKKIKAQARLLDLFPTLIELAGIKQTEQLRQQTQGLSLLPLFTGTDERRNAFSETDYLFHFSKKALELQGLKLIKDGFTGDSELYNLANDPLEKKNIFESEAARAYSLELNLSGYQRP